MVFEVIVHPIRGDKHSFEPTCVGGAGIAQSIVVVDNARVLADISQSRYKQKPRPSTAIAKAKNRDTKRRTRQIQPKMPY